MNSKKYKLLYFVSEDEYFISHKLEQLKHAQKKYEILVVSRFKNFEKKIISQGFKTQNINFDRKSLNPIYEFLKIIKFLSIIIKFKPDIIQATALKPILYLSLISFLIKRKTKIILCVVGLGYLFIKKNFTNTLIKAIYINLMKFFLRKKNSIYVFQNNDDKDVFEQNKLLRGIKYEIIKGSGVNTKIFKKKRIKKKYDIIFHSRILYDKGFNEIIESQEKLMNKKIKIKILILGSPDKSNRASVKLEILEKLSKEKKIIWKRKVSNVVPFLQSSKISVLPSYREGLPKSLIEAASCHLPIISTNVPGCKEVCVNNFNGITVEPKNSKQLSLAIEKMIKNEKLIKNFGSNGRKLVERNFSLKKISQQFLRVYSQNI